MFKFIVLIVGWGISFLIFMFRFAILEFLGDMPFAEKYLHGTKNFIVMVGVIIFIISLMYFLGTIQAVFVTLFAPFF